MSPRSRNCILALLGAALLPAAAHAQPFPDSIVAASYQGRSLFRVNINGGALFGGTFTGSSTGSNCTNGGSGSTCVPTEGAGTRMMWFPEKAAFRAGHIDGTQWDDANIGLYSVALGNNVRASGDNSVALGVRSVAANASSFAVGEDNTATGYASVAMGYHAHTNSRRGTFVFADNVTGGVQDSVRAERVGQAVWRLSCGMRIYTTQSLRTGVAFGGPSVNPAVCGSGDPYFDQNDAMISTSTGAYLSTSGTWTNASDVNRKHLFAEVAGDDVLARLRQMPVRTWSYRVDAGRVRHIGPTAQDFRRAFGLGNDSVSIATVDADGVALAAVQALDAGARAQQAGIDALRRENAELRATVAAQGAELAEVRRILARLEARAAATQP